MGINIQRPEKKLRGISRRLRSLKSWSESFRQSFPSQAEVLANGKYWNYKLPTDWAMVEGKQCTMDMKRQVAQCLVNACGYLIAAKPDWARHVRVTCVVALPDMFTSELCIYTSEDYFCGHLREGTDSNGVTVTHSVNPVLSTAWGLSLPEGVFEVGITVSFPGYGPAGEEAFAGDRWYFGEVTANPSVKGASCGKPQDAPYVER